MLVQNKRVLRDYQIKDFESKNTYHNKQKQKHQIKFAINDKQVWDLLLKHFAEDGYRIFWLSGCQISEKNIAYFGNVPLDLILVLNMCQNKIQMKAMKIFCNFAFNNLTKLNLNRNYNIGNNGAKYLAKVQMPELKELQLENCKIGDQGAKHLSKGNWKQLRNINLLFNNIGLNGCQEINNLNNWESAQLIKIISKAKFDDYSMMNVSQTLAITIKKQRLIQLEKQRKEIQKITKSGQQYQREYLEKLKNAFGNKYSDNQYQNMIHLGIEFEKLNDGGYKAQLQERFKKSKTQLNEHPIIRRIIMDQYRI